YSRMGVEEVPPLVKRAVLLDFPRYKGLDVLPERYEITPEDVEGALKSEGATINSGDAVLVRTGYAKCMTTDADSYLHKFAGLTAAGARHLASKKISVACSDNLAFGVPKPFELHQVFLVDNGIYMIKSLNMEELAKDRVYVSTLIVLPLKIRGATGSLVRPIALSSQ
ncbi:MAG: cyclase family protein, partial [Thaumarchaeota archaeon]|nr:cyclase family protein [Nitrososphaerota archaeon]